MTDGDIAIGLGGRSVDMASRIMLVSASRSSWKKRRFFGGGEAEESMTSVRW